MTLTCSRCHNTHSRIGQHHCKSCHATAQKKHRDKRNAEFQAMARIIYRAVENRSAA